ncbi:L-serine ammonia-lyase [Paralcaligenes ureilyticus]|uniref:L-serine dehydratase n=1 Tax=Paralcaligenes ureilyticus TaxID=627131 RepID=A0A4R3MDE1_9BURK|nr:L-serine ammonia-lyase [Paralcaligenes ureilyticus]TCT10933.1 L-serine ammonia-lyase [Paralcaligenes ureilyticus]
MSLSTFDLFKIGIGPSSSHTVGPMIAAARFAHRLEEADLLSAVAGLRIELYGSLGATGKGHGTDTAIMLGLCGYQPHLIDPDVVPQVIEGIRASGEIRLLNQVAVPFVEKQHIHFNRGVLALHSNGMRFIASDSAGAVLMKKEYYSIGGGFVMNCDGMRVNSADDTPVPYPYKSAAELLKMAGEANLTIAGLMMENEKSWRTEDQVRAGVLNIWDVMAACIKRGCAAQGHLPGPMKMKRRAAAQYRALSEQSEESSRDPLTMLDWVNLYAMAVNEENAAGGRVVTAPTNGAAGVVPAVLQYYLRFIPGANADGVVDFLLTAAAIGILYKENASISGAEVGCQGEVGVACSMAAGALAAVMGGTNAQIENAAEIGMEHNLGMTCDPVGGLVQIPCVERNAMGGVKAINAARLAMRGDGTHYVSLDEVIKTMMQTGADMKTKYKETSRGGLAVNVIEC